MGAKLNDYGKLALLLAILVSGTVLAALHVIPPEMVGYLLVGELGYITGNGVLARQGSAPSPVLVSSTPAQLVDQLPGPVVEQLRPTVGVIEPGPAPVERGPEPYPPAIGRGDEGAPAPIEGEDQ